MQTVCVLGGRPFYHDLSTLDHLRSQLSHLVNVAAIPLDADSLFRWTPMQEWWAEEFKYEPAESPWRAVHLSDAARLAFLWKYGGIYLDLDLVAVAPISQLALGRRTSFIGLQVHCSEIS